MSNAVIEHHFNNHKYCEEWCPVLKREWIRKGEIEKDEASDLKYWCKIKNSRLYTQVRAYHDAYTTHSSLWELAWGRQQQVWEFEWVHHKNKHKRYCRTIINEARTNVAISINSVWYQEYYRWLFGRLGIVQTTITSEHLRHLDHHRKWKAKHDKMKHIKKQSKMKLNEKIRGYNSNRPKYQDLRY
jgi:hypothetical protein